MDSSTIETLWWNREDNAVMYQIRGNTLLINVQDHDGKYKTTQQAETILRILDDHPEVILAGGLEFILHLRDLAQISHFVQRLEGVFYNNKAAKGACKSITLVCAQRQSEVILKQLFLGQEMGGIPLNIVQLAEPVVSDSQQLAES